MQTFQFCGRGSLSKASQFVYEFEYVRNVCEGSSATVTLGRGRRKQQWRGVRNVQDEVKQGRGETPIYPSSWQFARSQPTYGDGMAAEST